LYKKASSSVLAAQLLLVHTALLLSCGLTGWALQRIEGTRYILEHIGNSVTGYRPENSKLSCVIKRVGDAPLKRAARNNVAQLDS
jgi:hypothetical protein